jgi:hypothetical protein
MSFSTSNITASLAFVNSNLLAKPALLLESNTYLSQNLNLKNKVVKPSFAKTLMPALRRVKFSRSRFCIFMPHGVGVGLNIGTANIDGGNVKSNTANVAFNFGSVKLNNGNVDFNNAIVKLQGGNVEHHIGDVGLYGGKSPLNSSKGD